MPSARAGSSLWWPREVSPLTTRRSNTSPEAWLPAASASACVTNERRQAGAPSVVVRRVDGREVRQLGRGLIHRVNRIGGAHRHARAAIDALDRKSTRLNSSHL